jgi:hypothetical protein
MVNAISDAARSAVSPNTAPAPQNEQATANAEPSCDAGARPFGGRTAENHRPVDPGRDRKDARCSDEGQERNQDGAEQGSDHTN